MGRRTAWIGRQREFLDERPMAALLQYDPLPEAAPSVLADVAAAAGYPQAQPGGGGGTAAQ